jgi:hypothetical protein
MPAKNCQCCKGLPSGRWQGMALAVLPAVGLALVPKCPLCVAAYVAMFTGVGLSLAVASTIRLAMIAVCLAWLVIIVTRFLLRSTSATSSSRTSP